MLSAVVAVPPSTYKASSAFSLPSIPPFRHTGSETGTPGFNIVQLPLTSSGIDTKPLDEKAYSVLPDITEQCPFNSMGGSGTVIAKFVKKRAESVIPDQREIAEGQPVGKMDG